MSPTEQIFVVFAFGVIGYTWGRLCNERALERLERMNAKALRHWAEEADRAEKLEGERNEARRQAAKYKVQQKFGKQDEEEEWDWPDTIPG